MTFKTQTVEAFIEFHHRCLPARREKSDSAFPLLKEGFGLVSVGSMTWTIIGLGTYC